MKVDWDLAIADENLEREVRGPAFKEEENKVATLRNSSIQLRQVCLCLSVRMQWERGEGQRTCSAGRGAMSYGLLRIGCTVPDCLRVQ